MVAGVLALSWQDRCQMRSVVKNSKDTLVKQNKV